MEITPEPYFEAPSPPRIRPSGLPNRKTRRPARYQDFTDELPPLPPPIIPDLRSEDLVSPSLPYSVHITPPNEFGVFHTFQGGPPSYSPNEFYTIENASDSPNFVATPNTSSGWWTCFGSSFQHLKEDWFSPFLNASSFRLMRWFYGASNFKSLIELDELVQRVLLAEDFKVEELHNFRAARENTRLDQLEGKSDTPLSATDGWQQSSVRIPVAAEHFQHQNSSIPHYSVPGLFHRRPLAVIKNALTERAAQEFHLIPHHTHWRPSLDDPPERIYSELFSSDALIEEHEKIRSSPHENGCQLETVIISLMFWSDSTHLTSFGDSSLWPIYMFFGNSSKYTRGKPSTFSAHHLAYIPKVFVILFW